MSTATHYQPAVILIIDDNPTNIKVIVNTLKAHGFDIIIARDGEMGIKRAKFSHPDLILLDVLMPGMDGYETCHRLKDDEETSEIPVIFMTALNNVENKIKAFGIGGVDYITKPIQEEEVFARVRTHLQLRAQQKQLQQYANALEQANELAQEARAAADRANQAKSIFLANMSHELRSPLNAILGFARVMARSQTLPPEHQQHAGIIRRNGEHLLTLINQVLDLSKIEAGHITLNENNVDMHRLLQDVYDMFALNANKKHLHLLFDRDERVPRYVRTDEVKLRQVLINLLSNALKFTEKGKVELRIRNEELGMKRGKSSTIPNSQFVILNFSVADTGPGIAPEEIDQVFEAFAQTSAGQQAPEGTGLGLPISRKFVQLMGNDITVSSEVGQGTTFTFDLQCELADSIDKHHSIIDNRVVALEPGQHRYRMLIVDDNQDNRQLLFTLLNPFGFDLREAENGQEAIDIWDTWEPHLIWMDMRMPVMDGYEATKKIREAEEQSPIPIIAVTASSFEEEQAVVLSAGCNDSLRKPFTDAEVFDMLHKHLGVRFIYKEEKQAALRQAQDSAIDNNQTSIKEALAALPAEWLTTLKQGACRADFLLLASMIEQIHEQDPRLAGALAQLAEDFEYDEILTLIRML